MPHRLVPDVRYTTIFPDVSVRAMPINHGKNALGEYESAAFFIRHDPSLREFLFFGDVEPDSVAEKPRTINVWRAAASKIPETLSTLFIECSYPSGRPDNILFGHLTPEHLVAELSVLAQEVVAYRRQKSTSDARKRPIRKRQKRNSITSEDLKGALLGLRVCIIHCKDDASLGTVPPIREVILAQVRQLVDANKLGAKIFAAEQGACICECLVITSFLSHLISNSQQYDDCNTVSALYTCQVSLTSITVFVLTIHQHFCSTFVALVCPQFFCCSNR